MKANELRIGNLIYNNYKEEKYVVGTSYNKIMYTSSMGNFTYNECYDFDCEPIPLTEDWLLKFGFNFAHSTWYVKSTYLGDISSLEYINFCIQQKKVTIDDGYDEMTLCNINYVHQLQNLYFALTSEELIINENL